MPIIPVTQEAEWLRPAQTKSPGDPISTNKKLGVVTHICQLYRKQKQEDHRLAGQGPEFKRQC
jgi:hypothetical protein